MNNNFDNSQIKFIENMSDLVAYAYTHTAKFPRRFGSNYTNRIVTNITVAQECLEHANSIRVDYKFWKYGKTDATYNMYQRSYEQRTQYFDDCIRLLRIVAKLLDTGKRMEIQELVEDNDKVMKEFLDRIVTEVKLITGVKKTDQRAFKRFSIAFGKDFSTY